MPETPGTEPREGVEQCAGLDLGELLEFARQALSQREAEAELCLKAERKLTLEHELATGVSTVSEGETVEARASKGPNGDATVLLTRPEDLRTLLEAEPNTPLLASHPQHLDPLPRARAQEQAWHLTQSVPPPGTVVQAAVLTHTATWTAHLRPNHPPRLQSTRSEQAFIRCETQRGAVVDAVSLVPSTNPNPFESLRARLAEAREALEGPAEAIDPALPLVLRPAVAAPLVAALAWLLRGDVAGATPALTRAVGRKLFPAVLTVDDDPSHPEGTRSRNLDDEGVPATKLRLIDQGRLVGFLHSRATAARLGAEPNGRSVRARSAPPAPEALNLHIVPGADAPPERHTELIARVETFTTMPKPGTVSLVAAGWEVHEGRRVRRIAPVELDLPVLETFRALKGVGADLTFFPTAEGCGTPTLVFPPLLAGVRG